MLITCIVPVRRLDHAELSARNNEAYGLGKLKIRTVLSNKRISLFWRAQQMKVKSLNICLSIPTLAGSVSSYQQFVTFFHQK